VEVPIRSTSPPMSKTRHKGCLARRIWGDTSSLHRTGITEPDGWTPQSGRPRLNCFNRNGKRRRTFGLKQIRLITTCSHPRPLLFLVDERTDRHYLELPRSAITEITAPGSSAGAAPPNATARRSHRRQALGRLPPRSPPDCGRRATDGLRVRRPASPLSIFRPSSTFQQVRKPPTRPNLQPSTHCPR
jgi:hypothetical protein